MPIIYLPIETKTRDLEGRLLLIYFALKSGMNAVLIHKSNVKKYLKILPKGIYIHYGVHDSYKKEISLLRSFGHEVYAWDEEGLVFHSKHYFHNRISKNCFELINKFFAWGSYHKDYLIQNSPDLESKIEITGHPRFDLLNKQFREIFKIQSEELKTKYGRIILINTRFGVYNHFKGKEFSLQALRSKGYFTHESMKNDFDRLYEYDGKIFDEFMKIIPIICKKFPEHKIVLRPHPSENQDTWREAFSHLKNFEVIHDGNVINWLIASEATIHNNCTTGVEGYMLDNVSIAFRPFVSEEFDPYLPNELSVNAFTIDELIENIQQKVNKIFDDSGFVDSKKATAEHYISNCKGSLSSELILKYLLKDNYNLLSAKINIFTKIKLRLFGVKRALIEIIQKQISKNNKISYSNHKFPGVTLKELQYILELIKSIQNEKMSIKIEELEQNTFYFYTDNKVS